MEIIKNIDNLNLKGKGSYKDVDEAIANLQDADLAPKKYVDSFVASQISIINVLDFGADNNGVNDSSIGIQSALDFAETNGVRRVYVPTGEYLLRSTVYIPTEIEFFGDGMDKTIFKIDNQTVLDIVQMFDDSSSYQNFYIPLFATNKQRLSDANNNLLLRDFKIDDMYYIDNGALGQVCPMLIIRTNNSRLENIHFGSVQTEKEQDGITRSSLGCSVVFSENITLYRCIHLFAGYESLSIRFLSRNIITESNVFDIDKPSSLRSQTHASQTARPTALSDRLDEEYGNERTYGYKSINDSYLLKNNVGQGFTSHSSDSLIIQGAYVDAINLETAFVVFKIFDFSDKCIISDCVVNLKNSTGSVFMLATTSKNVYKPTLNSIVSNNIVNIDGYISDDTITSDSRSIIGNTLMDYENAVISGNIINIKNYNDGYFNIIGARGKNINISDNIINLIDGDASDNCVPIYVHSGNNISISNNISDGRCGFGIEVGEESELNSLYLDGNIIKGANNRKIQVPLSRNGAVKRSAYVVNSEFIDGIEDLSTSEINSTSIKLEWSNPITSKTILKNEVYVDGVLSETINNGVEGFLLDGLSSSTRYNIYLITEYTSGERVSSNLIYTSTESDPFITTWGIDITDESGNRSIEIGVDTNYTFNYDVDWGDGNGWIPGYDKSATHTYDSDGVYTVKIRGDFPALSMRRSNTPKKLLSVEAWGDIEVKSMYQSFHMCENLVLNASDQPNIPNIISMQSAFNGCSSIVGGLEKFSGVKVSSLRACFQYCTLFNSDISELDVSECEAFLATFRGCSNFNQDIGGWDVSNNNGDMRYMFENNEKFNQDLSSWCVVNILEEPTSFSSGTTAWVLPKPNWGEPC